MNEAQRAQAEAALAVAVARYPHESGAPVPHIPRTLMAPLQERYEQLLGFAKNPSWPLTALENLACARELIDTAYVLGAIDPGPWKAYVTETNLAKSELNTANLQRGIDARSRGYSGADENGVRPAIAEDGAYRFNPLTGGHE